MRDSRGVCYPSLARREGEGGWVPDGVGALVAKVDEVAERLGAKVGETEAQSAAILGKDLRALRTLAGSGAGRELELSPAQVRAWVQMLNHQYNAVAVATRKVAGATGDGGQARVQDLWRAVTAVEELRAMRDVLGGRMDEGQRRLEMVWGRMARDEVTGLPEEARIRARVQELYSAKWFSDGWQQAQGELSLLGTHTTMRGMADAVPHIGGPGVVMKSLQYWAKAGLAGMLSGPKTAALALTSNSLMTIDQVALTWIGAGLRPILRNNAEMVTARAAGAETAARVTSIGAALRHAAASFETGAFGTSRMAQRLHAEGRLRLHNTLDRANRWDSTGLAAGAAPDAARSMGQTLRNAADRVVSLPFTVLNAIDMFFKASNAYAILARKAAMEAGQVKQLSGSGYRHEVRELLEQPPYPWIDEAVQSGEDMTFTKPWGEAEKWGPFHMSKIGRGVDAIPPVGRLVGLPFITVPTRALSAAFERLPGVGLLAKRQVWDEDLGKMVQLRQWSIARRGGVEGQMVAARQVWGAALFSGAVLLAMKGQISGGGREGFRGRGSPERPEYSIRMGDGWIEYDRLDTLGRVFGVAADVAEVLSLAEDGPAVQGVGDVSAMVVESMKHHLSSSAWLQSAAELVTVLDDVAEGDIGGGAALGRFMARPAVAGSVPFSSLLRAGDRGFSPEVRDTRGVRKENEMWHEAFFSEWLPRYKANVPGLSSDLPARRDGYGRPIQRLGPTFGEDTPQGLGWSLLSPVAYHEDTKDPGYQAMRRLGWAPPPWPKRSGGVAYTFEERDRLAAIAGPIFEASLGRHVRAGALDGYLQQVDGVHGAAAMRMGAAEVEALYANALSQARAAYHGFAVDWQRSRYERREAMARERMAVRDAYAAQAAIAAEQAGGQ